MPWDGPSDVTLFMTLLAVFQTMLHRYTGQDDIVVGHTSGGAASSRNRDDDRGFSQHLGAAPLISPANPVSGNCWPASR